ncbi:T9SS type A sorting domain-containing protein [Bacteroidota bacterium]
MKKYFSLLPLLVISIFLLSWGNPGHRTVGSGTAKFLNEEMSQFNHWPAILAEHGSDADYRKSTDPTEEAKHYIDIDNYPEFDTTGRIPQILDSVYMYHTTGFVDSNGYLPWATRTTYDSVKSCFLRRDWDRAVLFAADLGHYVADAHVPLHLTRNYNGQNTGNYGIHSRYESTMIGVYISEINFDGDSINVIKDVNSYIFDYIYRNYIYVDSLILADDYAQELAGNTSSSVYTAALWEKTRSFTIPLFRNASLALTELIYTAWDEAGRPSIDITGIEQYKAEHGNPGTVPGSGIYLEQNYPNPFSHSTSIRFRLTNDSEVKLRVMDGSGRQISVLIDDYLEQGDYNIQWQPENLSPGLYYLVISEKGSITSQKMVYQPLR